jgi:hypothetical protein
VSNENIMDYARSLMDNKSVWDRIGHSSSLHSLRSATKSPGSAVSKGAAVGLAVAKKAMQLIPIPVLGDLAGEVTGIVEKKVRKEMHDRNLKKATTSADKVKFKLKDLSVEEFDRYRWKLADAVKELQSAQQQYNGVTDPGHNVCKVHLDVAVAIAQASRRHRLLTELCETMLGTMLEAIDWANDVNADIKKAEADLLKAVSAQATYDADNSGKATYDGAYRHGGCGGYCYSKGTATLNSSSAFKRIAIDCTRELAELAKPELYYSLSQNPYKAS